eukprot:1770349-Amphidinium_carterae.1
MKSWITELLRRVKLKTTRSSKSTRRDSKAYFALLGECLRYRPCIETAGCTCIGRHWRGACFEHRKRESLTQPYDADFSKNNQLRKNGRHKYHPKHSHNISSDFVLDYFPHYCNS